MPSKPVRILVLADTHDHLPPNVAEIAKGVDEIWHLGDVCASSVLEKLEELGPTVALVAVTAIAIPTGRWLSISSATVSAFAWCIFRLHTARKTLTCCFTDTLTFRATSGEVMRCF
jgi:hypothetical protein